MDLFSAPELITEPKESRGVFCSKIMHLSITVQKVQNLYVLYFELQIYCLAL